jgi:hypothetical protein
LDIIFNLLETRTFFVKECGQCSTSRRQLSGISQGCTLSPLLFVMVMSVLLTDAMDMLSKGAKDAHMKGDLADMVYADDTLLLSVSDAHLNEYLHAVAAAGARYGMELHWGKFQLLPVQCTPKVHTPDGQRIPLKSRMEYLGTILTDDLHDHHELVRRIALAKADFIALETVWGRSALTWRRKLGIYSCLIQSKLLYSLSSVCLTVAQIRKLNGFQNRCLRKIIGIAPSFVSRVTNAEVLRRCAHLPAADLLLKHQLSLLGKVLRSPEGHPLRTASFMRNSDTPATEQFVRRRGRPAKEWVREVMQEALILCGSAGEMVRLASDKHRWQSFVSSHRRFAVIGS